MLGGLFIDGERLVADAHRYKVGDIEVTVLSDGFRMVPVDDKYLANAGADDLAKALAAAGQPTDKMKNTYSPIVLDDRRQARAVRHRQRRGGCPPRAKASAARSTPISRPPASTATRSTWW